MSNSSKFAWVESEGSICHMDGSAAIISQLWPVGHTEEFSSLVIA